MESSVDDLVKITAYHQEVLTTIVARNKAFEYAIRVLLNTHQDPERLHLTWTSVCAGVVDAHMEYPSFQSEKYRDAFQEGLALVSRTIELAAANPDEDA